MNDDRGSAMNPLLSGKGFRSRSAALFFLAAGTLLSAAPASALCIQPSDPALAALQARIFSDPKAALASAEARLAQAGSAERKAWLHAIAAAAYGRLEMNSQERGQADEGLKLGLAPSSDVRAELEMEHAISLSFPDEIKAARTRLEALRKRHPMSSPANVCLQAMVGLMSASLGEIGEGGVMITNAYERATRLGFEMARFAITGHVIAPLVKGGDYPQALEIIEEGERYAEPRGYAMEMENLHYMRGQVLLRLKDYSKARDAFAKMRSTAAGIKDEQGVGYADLALCEIHLELNDIARAKTACASVARIFKLVEGKSDSRVIWLQARIALKEGRLSQAKQALDALIAGKYPATSAQIVTQAYRSRADVLTEMGRFEAAAADLREAQKRYEAEVETSRTRYVAIMRGRFEANRRQLENEKLQRTLSAAREQDQRRRLWIWTLAGWAAFLLVAFVGFFLFARRQQRMLVAHADEARMLAQTKADFLSNMSHEIRRPLGSLLLSAQMLAGDKGVEIQNRDLARRLSRTGDRLIHLLDDLLLFSRIETGDIPIRRDAFDLKETLAEVIDASSDKAAGKGIDVHINMGASFPTQIIGDGNKIAQIVSNLLDNAIAHSGASTIEVRVTRREGGMFVISVEDNGAGIAPEDQPRLFRRFSQVDGSLTRNGGSGLGLTIAKGLCELMGGTIKLKSAPGKGTKVSARLPLTIVARAEEEVQV